MTTVTADIINASVGGNPVNIRRLVHNDPTDTTKQFKYNTSGNTTGKTATLRTTCFGNGNVIFPNIGSYTVALTTIDNNFTSMTDDTRINCNTLTSATGSNRINIGASQKTIIKFPKFTADNGGSVSITASGGSGKIADLSFPSAAGNVEILLPDATGSLVVTSVANTYTQQQTFSANIKANTINGSDVNGDIVLSGNGTGQVVLSSAIQMDGIAAKTTNGDLVLAGNGTGKVIMNGEKVDSITAKSTNTDLSLTPDGTGKIVFSDTTKVDNVTASVALSALVLQPNGTGIVETIGTDKTNNISGRTNTDLLISGNGTGSVVISGTEKVDSIVAKTTNGNLSISGNGTGVVAIGTNGFKFANEAIKDYASNTFVVAFTIGAFSTGNLTLQYERVGRTVTLRIPPATGTPAINGIWTSGAIPTIIRPITEQTVLAGLGISNASKPPLYIRITAAGALIASHTTSTGGLGNVGTCGWQYHSVITYSLD